MILRLLQKLVRWLVSKDRKAQEQARKEALTEFVHQTLPARIEGFENRLIIENGSFNYFVLPSDKLPKFDYVFPEVPLFIRLLTPENSDWELAERYGVSKDRWSREMADRAALKTGVQELPMSERPILPLFWELDWGMAMDQESLLNDFRTKVRAK